MWGVAAWASWYDHSALTDEIHRHDPEIRHCYERELPRMDPREGKLVVRFTLDLDGDILDVRVKDDTLGSERLAACVLDVFRSMWYPPQRGVLVVTWPLLFSVAPQVARTVDHDTIRRWALALGGSAARTPDGALRVAFPGDTEAVPIGWEAWFRLFDEGRLVFVYEPGGHRYRVDPRYGGTMP
jgi:hypothetical protein